MARTTQPTIDIRPADTRIATNAGWLEWQTELPA
jgi:hypothetical protein